MVTATRTVRYAGGAVIVAAWALSLYLLITTVPWSVLGPNRVYGGAFLFAVVAPVAALAALWLIPAHRPIRAFVAVWLGVFALSLAANPVVQVLALESLDLRRGAALAERADASGVIGMNAEQLREVLGEPSFTTESDKTLTWAYKQLPGYWLGSHFEVFLKHGVVVGFEPNDD